MTVPVPQSWQEFQKGGTAIRRTGFQDGTWMDPPDARPMRARVRVNLPEGDFTIQAATIRTRQKPTIECGLVMWPATVRLAEGSRKWYQRKYVRGYVTIGQYGYEFNKEA